MLYLNYLLCLVPFKAEYIAVKKTMRAIISYDGIPFVLDFRFVLNNNVFDPTFFRRNFYS